MSKKFLENDNKPLKERISNDKRNLVKIIKLTFTGMRRLLASISNNMTASDEVNDYVYFLEFLKKKNLSGVTGPCQMKMVKLLQVTNFFLL